MELMNLYKSIEELGFEAVINGIAIVNGEPLTKKERGIVQEYNQRDVTYRDKQFELLHTIETNIACYKAVLREYDDKDGIIR
jgi:hypothetical protein